MFPNRLIDGLPSKERDRVVSACETVSLEHGQVVCDVGEQLRYVYFPQTSFISLMAPTHDHPPLEVVLVGHEGMVGTTLILDVVAAPSRGIVQGPGTALRLTAPQFRRLTAPNSALLERIKHYLFVRVEQLSRNVACARFHLIEARLAAWLLTAHDRAHADHFHLTHVTLADLLGVQRSAVTIAAGALQSRDIIRYTRGEIHIVDRQGLELAACRCHAQATQQYDLLLN